MTHFQHLNNIYNFLLCFIFYKKLYGRYHFNLIIFVVVDSYDYNIFFIQFPICLIMLFSIKYSSRY